VADRARRDRENGGDLGVGLAERDPGQDFGLAPRQTQRRQIPGRDRRALLVEKDESLPGMAQAAQDEPRIVALGDER
jgi:hypothetical protein